MNLRFKYLSKILSSYLKPEIKVVDVGCGDGYISTLLIEHFGVFIHGTDIKNLLHKKSNVNFTLMKEKTKLPFGSKNFDVVTYIEMLHHLDRNDHIGILEEGKRVGNSILICDTEPSYFAYGIDIVMNATNYFGKVKVPLTFLKHEDWVIILNNLGFKNVKYEKVKVPFWYPVEHFVITAKSE